MSSSVPSSIAEACRAAPAARPVQSSGVRIVGPVTPTGEADASGATPDGDAAPSGNGARGGNGNGDHGGNGSRTGGGASVGDAAGPVDAPRAAVDEPFRIVTREELDGSTSGGTTGAE